MATSVYHRMRDGATGSKTHRMAQIMSRVVKKREKDWDEQLPDVEAASSNSANTSTGLDPKGCT